MNLVVNADDFGRSASRNKAIDSVICSGYVNQASLMVNTPYTDEAVMMAECKNYKGKICLHLNLTYGIPLTEPIKKTDFCNSDGNFVEVKDVYTTLRCNLNRKCIQALRTECEAQIQKFISYGFDLLHLDSHNWIHLHIPVWIALYPLLKKYGIKSVRPMRKGLKKFHGKKHRIYYIIMDIFLRMSGYFKNNYSSNLEEFLQNCEELDKSSDLVEVFTHPDFQMGEIMDLSWSYVGEKPKTMKYVDDKLKRFHERYTYKEFYSR